VYVSLTIIKNFRCVHSSLWTSFISFCLFLSSIFVDFASAVVSKVRTWKHFFSPRMFVDRKKAGHEPMISVNIIGCGTEN
jgi:hypothetical protein